MNKSIPTFSRLALTLTALTVVSCGALLAMDEEVELKGILFLQNNTAKILETNVKSVVETWQDIKGSLTGSGLDLTKLQVLDCAKFALPAFAHGKTGVLPSGKIFSFGNLFKLVSWGATFASDKYFIQPKKEKLLGQLNKPKNTLLTHLQDKQHYSKQISITSSNKAIANQELITLQKESRKLELVPITQIQRQFGILIGPLQKAIEDNKE